MIRGKCHVRSSVAGWRRFTSAESTLRFRLRAALAFAISLSTGRARGRRAATPSTGPVGVTHLVSESPLRGCRGDAYVHRPTDTKPHAATDESRGASPVLV